MSAKTFAGISSDVIGRGNRIIVDRINRVKGIQDIFALGDLAVMATERYPDGHPQVAQVAIQQSRNLAKNILRIRDSKKTSNFEYSNKGSLAAIGRNLAVADLPIGKLKGFLAWFLWSLVHLFTIVGVKNRVFIFLNWSWNYFTYDQSLRLLIRHKPSSNNGITKIKSIEDQPLLKRA